MLKQSPGGTKGQSIKKPYQRPILVVQGDFRRLTLTATKKGGVADGSHAATRS